MGVLGANVGMPHQRQGTAMSRDAHVAAFTDPEAYAFEAIKLAAGANVLGFGNAIGKTFHARLTRVSLDRLSVGLGKASASVTLSSGVPNAHVFMFATEPYAARRISGWTVGHRHIFHPRPNDHAFSTSPRQPGAAAVITVPFDLLDAYGAGVTGLDPNVPMHDDRLFLAPEAQRTRLVSLMNDVERLAREGPWIVQMPAPARALENALMEALLACLTMGPATATPDPRSAGPPPPNRREPGARTAGAPGRDAVARGSLRRSRCRAENLEPRLRGIPRSERDAIRPRAPSRSFSHFANACWRHRRPTRPLPLSPPIAPP